MEQRRWDTVLPATCGTISHAKAYQTLYFRTVAPIGHAQSVLHSMNITCTYSANILLLSVLFYMLCIFTITLDG